MTLSCFLDQHSHLEIEVCAWMGLETEVCARCWLGGFKDREFVPRSNK
jgi:hypothetical protein